MNRTLAFFAALLFAAISVASACMAGPMPETITFQLRPSSHSGNLQLALWERRDGHNSNMGSSYALKDLVGLDYRALTGAGSNPVSFAIVREPGRLDCAGTSTNSLASGTCRFTADPSFADYLAAHGIARPNRDEAFGLTMTEASRSLVEVLAANK